MTSVNPFTPGFNRKPAFLAGRDEVIEHFDLTMRYVGNGSGLQPIMLVGPRGMGKTVLQACLIERARSNNWGHIHIEMRKNLGIPDIIEDIINTRNSNWQLGNTEVNASVGIPSIAQLSGKIALQNRKSLPSLHNVLTQVLEKADTGILLTIDEAHETSKNVLQELGSAIQALVPANPHLIVLAAGLPLVRHKVTTYFERARWFNIGHLNNLQSLDLLIATVKSAGKELSPQVAVQLAYASGGYPFALQTVGFEAWEISSKSHEITASHADVGLERTMESFNSGLFYQRWLDSSPEQREYLIAMATLVHDDKTYVTGGEIAQKLHLASHKLSATRQKIIDKGTIIVEDNRMRFLVPGMAQWVLSQEV